MRATVWLLIVLLGTAGCAALPPGPALTVFAASSLAGPLEELGALHELRGRQAVRLHAGASGTLGRQLREGAPADVFISADERVFDSLAASGVIDPASRTIIAINRLALVIPAQSPPAPTADILANVAFRIGVGDPDVVPVGRYAREWLEAHGVWSLLLTQRRLVLAPSAQAVLAHVRAGATDAAVVFRSDAVTARDLRVIEEVAVEATSPIRYVGGVVSASRSRQAATIYLDILAGPEGQRVLADAGFLPREPDRR